MRPRRAAVLLAAALAAALGAPTAMAATAQQTIAALNAQRAANGIPAGIVENPILSAACAKHDHYMALNHTLTHVEDPSLPGYTPDGAAAGRDAVLTQGAGWDNGNPYEYAPLHLDQLLAPRLISVGSADGEGFSCTTTFPGWTRPDPAMTTVYSYPGNRGKIYPSELANELPWTPGDLVGLAGRTGPNLLVFVDAPGQAPTNNPATLSDARLTGPGGAVELRTVDGMTSLPKGSGYPTLAPFISPGGFIIPVRPLAPASTYQAHVVVTFGGIQTPHDWSFTTLGADPHSRLSARFGRLTFRSDSQRAIRVSFARTGGGRAPPVTIRPGHSVKLKLPPGVWRACGHQSAAGRFAGYDGCLTVRVTGVPSLKLGAPSVSGGAVHLSLSFSAVLRGRSATLIVTPLWRRCSRPGNCRTLSGRPADSRIVLRRTSVTLPLPALEHGFRVEVRTSAFELDDAPWSAAHAVTSFIRR